MQAYRERNAFILTQAPLQNTIEDFWIMIVNYDIRTIVMLNTHEEGNEVSMHKTNLYLKKHASTDLLLRHCSGFHSTGRMRDLKDTVKLQFNWKTLKTSVHHGYLLQEPCKCHTNRWDRGKTWYDSHSVRNF